MKSMKIEVVRAASGAAQSVSLTLPPGATVLDAVLQSGLPHGNLFGVYGKRVAADHRLADGDRVEIYRPLAMDPKEARRLRARGKR
jgi:putative ubiquitin-RnfH superfamily antitoxin RatB of RatAB toxin-antitoxin module